MAFVTVSAPQLGSHPPVRVLVDTSGMPHRVARRIHQLNDHFVFSTVVLDKDEVEVFCAKQSEPRHGRSIL
jgi:hypothetical protein